MAWPTKRRTRSKGSLVKRARGNLKSSKSNSDSLTQTITFTAPVVLSGKEYTNYTHPITGETKTHYAGVVALNIWDALSRAPNFQAFQRMYDQVRLDYSQITLNVANSTINTSEASTTYDIYTAWDRTGIDNLDVIPKISNAGGVASADGAIIILNTKITETNHQKSVLNAFQRWRKTLWIYPRTIQEKSQYISTGAISVWRDPYNTTDLYYPLKDDIQETTTKKAGEKFYDFMNSDNPALFCENGKYPFKPTLLIAAFRSGVEDGEGKMNIPLMNTTKIVMTADFKCVCTFRGSKGAASIS